MIGREIGPTGEPFMLREIAGQVNKDAPLQDRRQDHDSLPSMGFQRRNVNLDPAAQLGFPIAIGLQHDRRDSGPRG